MFLLRCIVLVFVSLVLQTTWMVRFRIGGIQPDLLLGIVFLLALRKGNNWGVWAGFAIGLLVGVEEPSSLGVESLALGLTGLLLDRARAGVDRQNPIVLVLLLFISSILADSIRVLWISGFSPASAFLLWVRWALPAALYTTLVLPVLAWASGRILGMKGWVSGAP
jgi:rod shape-determining protein MreD